MRTIDFLYRKGRDIMTKCNNYYETILRLDISDILQSLPNLY